MEDLIKVKNALTFSFHIYQRGTKRKYSYGPETKMEGHRNKNFYRVNRKYFSCYVDNAMFGIENSYISYISEIIKDGDILNYLSALVKDLDNDKEEENMSSYELVYREVIASQIMNYFDCPTVFNSVVYDINKKKFQLFSLDFISYNEDFFSLDEKNIYLTSYMESNVHKINKMLRDGTFCNDEDREKVIKDFIYSTLVRKYMLRDYDFYHTNVGILAGDRTHLINFDYEYVLKEDVSYYKNELYDTLSYCKEHYPDVYEKFINKFVSFYKGVRTLLLNKELKPKDYVEEEVLMGLIKSFNMTITVLNVLGLNIDNDKEIEEMFSIMLRG